MCFIRISALAQALAVLLGAPTISAACTCVSMPLCESLWMRGKDAPAFFEATVEAIEPVDAGIVRVRLRDVRPVHGASAASLVTSPDEGSCGTRSSSASAT